MKILCSWVVGAGLSGLALAAGCGNHNSQIGEQGGPANGESCGQVGTTSKAHDGCNTCTCGADGRWACTLIQCNASCTNGETRPAGDGCNTCTCTQNQWACTVKGCGCVLGETKSDGCNTCSCTSNGLWACTDRACECTPGETKPAGDGCNTCTCSASHEWGCTLLGCPDPVCTNGQTKPAGDGCNTCSCLNGQWGCTLINCDCPAPRPPADAQACDTVMVWAKRPPQTPPVWGATCCLYNTACQAPEGWATYTARAECEAAPQCPAPAPEDGRSCPPVTVYAKDPASGACCFYSDPCRAPMNWKTYSTEDECKAGP